MLPSPFVFIGACLTSAGIAILTEVYVIFALLLPTIGLVSGICATVSTNPLRLWIK
jgi:hypothetical protein